MKCEICNHTAQHEHHIVSKSFKGSNKAHNIAHLCASCHHDLHHGPKIIIEGRFLTDDGYTLIWHMKGEESITGMESDQVYLVRTTGTHC
jgi:hypothetical protein